MYQLCRQFVRSIVQQTTRNSAVSKMAFRPPDEVLAEVKRASQTAKSRSFVDVPLVLATDKSLCGYGHFLNVPYSEYRPTIKGWPSPVERLTVAGGTNGDGIEEYQLKFAWSNGRCVVTTAEDEPRDVAEEADAALFVRQADAHPNSDQVFNLVERPKGPYIAVLSKCQRESYITPMDFVAFYINDRRPLVVSAGVYHNLAYATLMNEDLTFNSKNSSMLAYMTMNFVNDFGVQLRIPNFRTAKPLDEIPERVTRRQNESSLPPSITLVTDKFVYDQRRTSVIWIANEENFKLFGNLVAVPDDSYDVELLSWPTIDRPVRHDNLSTMMQQFILEWTKAEGDEENVYDLVFRGTDGRCKGGMGKPGVQYNSKTRRYTIEPLLCRPDGGFYVYPTDSTKSYIYVVCETDENTKEPICDSLTAYVIPPGAGVYMKPISWHSPPIPFFEDGSAEFREKISAMDSCLAINTKEEAGTPITLDDPKNNCVPF